MLFVRPIDVTRGFGFRIAALTTALVLVSMVALGMAVYSSLDDALEARVQARIERELNRLLGLNESALPGAISSEVERRVRADSARRFA